MSSSQNAQTLYSIQLHALPDSQLSNTPALRILKPFIPSNYINFQILNFQILQLSELSDSPLSLTNSRALRTPKLSTLQLSSYESLSFDLSNKPAFKTLRFKTQQKFDFFLCLGSFLPLLLPTMVKIACWGWVYVISISFAVVVATPLKTLGKQ